MAEKRFAEIDIHKIDTWEAMLGSGFGAAILQVWSSQLYTQIWGRCYDKNFVRFLPIFGEKFGAFLKIQCYV
jgi:hypothetical protein